MKTSAYRIETSAVHVKYIDHQEQVIAQHAKHVYKYLTITALLSIIVSVKEITDFLFRSYVQ